MKIKSVLRGHEVDFTMKIGDEVLNLKGEKDLVADIIHGKMDCSVRLGSGGYEIGSVLQEYNNRFNIKVQA